ncbi:MAG: DUF4364 family protein [Lachnospiraceae bacterium]
MTQDPLTLYKLIVLYMLNRVTFPLTKNQITDFIQEKEYTGFFTLQQVMAELIDTGLVTAKTVRNRTLLSITSEGLETLRFFENRISDAIKEDIDTYFSDKEMELKNEVSIQGDYYKSVTGDYEAHLVAKEKGANLIELTLSVPTEEIASSICDNWQKKNQEIYQYLVSSLF